LPILTSARLLENGYVYSAETSALGLRGRVFERARVFEGFQKHRLAYFCVLLLLSGPQKKGKSRA